ncbi:hypothetical protein BCR44DRAFT_1498743 [Catenaria anguillulae PL171]|uniref:Uncharacterized protein n=1 Tax=Catenaria anguillulae PL171 TaxID=765915 RepID=A0A1Y2HPP8_9FUNG|nr:hypothetical protein BCR44DRAFT_1498743 [Catenaria anguillulae PL171]
MYSLAVVQPCIPGAVSKTMHKRLRTRQPPCVLFNDIDQRIFGKIPYVQLRNLLPTPPRRSNWWPRPTPNLPPSTSTRTWKPTPTFKQSSDSSSTTLYQLACPFPNRFALHDHQVQRLGKFVDSVASNDSDQLLNEIEYLDRKLKVKLRPWKTLVHVLDLVNDDHLALIHQRLPPL